MNNTTQHTPLLVGIGVATQRAADWALALEPMDLMLEAVQAAGRDAGTRALLAGTQYIGVPRGRWNYRNPAGVIARHIGAPECHYRIGQRRCAATESHRRSLCPHRAWRSSHHLAGRG